MNAKHTVKPRDIAKRLEADGWTKRGGKGDHVNYKKPGHGLVTLDMGVKEIPIGTLRGIYRIAGWEW